MKKYSVALLLALIAISPVGSVQAATSTNDAMKMQLIASLLEQIKLLQAKLDAMKNSNGTESKTDNIVNEPAFEEKNVGQTIYEGYGAYGFDLEITAKDNDILIPQTTTDSTSGITGIAYSVTGQEFRGDQNSKITCAVKYKGYCKIKAGKMGILDVTVWLTPNESGTYGVDFKSVSYLETGNEDIKTYKLDAETEEIYLE